mmetsp:Transcript_41076/g.49995  ORF Transcript_41076/g.49995 Transcript_41076/m.49995 type:complete len:410 (-) Transcript_41076:316-1545(-)
MNTVHVSNERRIHSNHSSNTKTSSWSFSSLSLALIILLAVASLSAIDRFPNGHSKGLLSASLSKSDVDCAKDDKYTKRTVMMAYESSFASLFRRAAADGGLKRYEASGVTIVGELAYAICDTSWSVTKVDLSLDHNSPGENVQIDGPERDGSSDSGFEAIFYHKRSFYTVRESILIDENNEYEYEVIVSEGKKKAKKSSYHAIIEELEVGNSTYTVKSACRSEYEFDDDSKGFEGAVGFADSSGELFIIALCEGNYCASKSKSAESGNGRVVLMKKDGDSDDCMWKTHRVVKIPKTAKFKDYSDIDIDNDGRVVISSQENSEVWIGRALGIDNGVIDPEGFDFSDNKDDSATLQFPKGSECETVYCNIEGIQWMGKGMLLAVSDKMKGDGRQSYSCFDKDQSIHAFTLP